ncbi:D-alanyl-D-alanine carboxypeptidase/D-alanyl-D-alanine endopeptidase [Pseudonocardia sp.]|uniref:D-alanyl-D-alanine carboxypeptidase/D-alanyl-D-alanine endopeptidase n=1 Tax=Pseudonocardia sp. TaxID=60912 RepID=UPI003D127675
MTRRWTPMLALVVLLLSACTSGGEPPAAGAGGEAPPPGNGTAALTAALLAIEQTPRYQQADWGYLVLDQQSGEVLVSQNPVSMFDAGSTMKTFAVSAALDRYGSDYVFRTPVYRAGTQSGDTLTGNLVLVGSGDLSFGLRKEPDGSLSYENLPAIDHSYATTGFPGAVEPQGDPLSALNELAASVKAAGISRVNGDVVVDDRLFTPHEFPDGLVSPIWVNENLIDIKVAPGAAAGQATTIDWRPRTASYTVETQATTVAATESTALQVTEPTPGRLVVTGTIAAGAPTLVVSEITDPSAFARTAFIEALQRAGVTVTAVPTGPNPAALLPAKDSYPAADKLGEHVSANLGAYVTLIMKVSYNRGADLMTCLAAVKTGSTDCEQGLVAEVDTATGLGVAKDQMFAFDGAGSDDRSRVTPTALATFYKDVTRAPYATVFADSLPILGKDGTLANVLTDSPAAGKIRMKTGNRVVGTEADQIIVLGNSLAGYIEAASGRKLTIMIAVGNVPIATPAEFTQVTADQAQMAVAIQQAF